MSLGRGTFFLVTSVTLPHGPPRCQDFTVFTAGLPVLDRSAAEDTLYCSIFDAANNPICKPQRRIEYFCYETGGGVPCAIGTSAALSAAVRGNGVIVAWKGIEGSRRCEGRSVASRMGETSGCGRSSVLSSMSR
jgi:hypothetical protein